MPLIDANGIKLHYRIDGPERGRQLLLSNSLASNLEMWDPQIGDLTSAGYRVIRYDSRGHGGSDAPEGPYSIEMLAEDAVALLDGLGLAKADFCGLSKGGMVGQMLGVRHADRVGKLILADTGAYMPTKEMWDGRIKTVEKGGMEAVADATIERWFTPASRLNRPGDIEKIHAMILGTPPQGFIGCSRAIQAMDQRGTIGGITAPTLVIVGAEDPATTPDHAKEIHGLIGGSQYLEIPEAAHFANFEQPQLFTKAMLGFLNG
ncbi:3-oxoadipate enol-lactonase [Nisaea acidiphila]|uniref:3-oxoadipate enol-lactonase n=1 Tax=Nisaea acidiphila TaxID=1862145 RepID=A0A9J7AZF5_9PROT|nr:3-oxoadipate enol-lactonase [Nisaea acidiphila]UUX51636.1 3-oxoadipate enol-lactonase [Nisaea acidiphila]